MLCLGRARTTCTVAAVDVAAHRRPRRTSRTAALRSQQVLATRGQAVASSEHVALLVLVQAADELGVARHRVARLVEGAGSALRVLDDRLSGFEPVDTTLAGSLRRHATADHLEQVGAMLDRLAAEHPDVELVTVLDEAYPTTLRRTSDRTPALFVRGDLALCQRQAVAVVGTRRPSPGGADQAARLARGLAAAGTTVVSGLATGIDTAAHRGAVDAGGRTVAVLGHGIAAPIYPAQNTDLAHRIVASGGAVVSQFWPQAPPTPATFPLRNVTTSGLAAGTVVIEAGETSGARQQARKCLEHGKQLFLLESLVTAEPWARSYAERPGAVVVRDSDDVLTHLAASTVTAPPAQLVLG